MPLVSPSIRPMKSVRSSAATSSSMYSLALRLKARSRVRSMFSSSEPSDSDSHMEMRLSVLFRVARDRSPMTGSGTPNTRATSSTLMRCASMSWASTELTDTCSNLSPPDKIGSSPFAQPLLCSLNASRSVCICWRLSCWSVESTPDGRFMLLKNAACVSDSATLIPSARAAALIGLSPISGWRGVCWRKWMMSRAGAMNES